MRLVQATWRPERGLFLWSRQGPIEGAIAAEMPELVPLLGAAVTRPLAAPGPPLRRKPYRGYALPLDEIIPHLPPLKADPGLSDSLRCWSMATRLGLELAMRQAVVPDVRNGEARWKVLLARRDDRERFDALVSTIPVSCRLIPTQSRGPVRLATAGQVVRDFLDSLVDAMYRQGAYAGPTRGWSLELADALRGGDAAFQPKDARYQGVPQKLSAWSHEDDAMGLRLGMTLHLPTTRPRFKLSFFVHPTADPTQRVPLEHAWTAGSEVIVEETAYRHPAHTCIRGLARAKRVFPAIAGSLNGKKPHPLHWSPKETWSFLAEGVPALRDAGFEIDLPESFAEAGSRRIRARMRIVVADGAEINLADMLQFHWEVMLGDLQLTGHDFAEIVGKREPIVNFRGEWVLLDPAELARLPKGIPQAGALDATSALRAVLTGQHEGVPVVADERLDMLVSALRSPPDVEPPATLDATLRPYQLRGFSWLTTLGNMGLGACLADDMGLGKTVQVIAHMLARHHHQPGRKHLVVVPTSVLGNWKRELARFAPELSVIRHHGLGRSLAASLEHDVVLTTYGLLVRDIDALAEAPWDVVALDEAQNIKNPDSQRARCARRLPARHRVAMSGTPVENRLDELWSLMEYLIPSMLGTRGRFRRHYAIPIEKFGDQGLALQLKRGVSPFLLRRVKTDPDIIPDLPDKVERKMYCALTGEQAALYKQVVADHFERIQDSEAIERRGHVLAMLTALKQVCNHPDHYLKGKGGLAGRSGKLDRTSELVEGILAAGDRAIMFTQYREMGDRLQRHLREAFDIEAPFLHGGVATDNRDAMVASFQDDDDGPSVLIISLRAGGTGLNLTRATHVLHFDRWWNPAVEDQATDRAYRIGQHRNVQVYKLVCQGTLEEKIDALLEEKRGLAESVVGSGERLVTELDDASLKALVSLGEDAVLEEE